MSQFADVTKEAWGIERTCYTGTLSALVATGLFKPEWFPGQPGNGATGSTFVFTDDQGHGYILKRGTKNNLLDHGFGRVTINRYGKTVFKVCVQHTDAEIEASKAKQQSLEQAKDWQTAKAVRADKQDVVWRWKAAIRYEIANFEHLCKGEACFTDMPDVRIQGFDLERIQDAIATLRSVFMESTPVIHDVVVRSNVISIREGAHRGLKKRA
jgi:hypothetical protein